MKTFLKVLAWVIGVPVGIVALFTVLGFAAIRWNFWPPTCSVLPIPEAKRVCEFSKLDAAPKGKPATIAFWVTVPENTPRQDTVLLVVAGKEPVAMDRINITTFEKTLSATTGDILSYHYERNSAASHSGEKTFKVRALSKTVYDTVSDWNDLPPSLSLNKDLVGILDMKDTWTINYNMNLFEDTRRNIDASMDHAVLLGDKEFGVYSFIDMAGGKDTFTVKETVSPYYHWRDAAITEGEMKTLEKKAKARGLAITLHYNVGADYNQYYDVNPIGAFTGGQAGSGIGGNAAEQRAAADFGRDKPKTKAWLDRYFTQLEAVLIEWGGRAERAGIDAIDITPQYRPPSVAPEFAYADERYSQIIKNLRAVYHGKIYGSNFASYGGMGQGIVRRILMNLIGSPYT